MWTAAAMAVVGVSAFLLRLEPVLAGGGIKGNGDYDDGVYYASAIEILHGKVPYRDFVLLHPPGMAYLLVPFAALGDLVGDANGFATARVAFMLIGAATAVTAVWVGSRHSLACGVACGVVYAVWAPAVHVEYTTLMEVPSNLMLMLALGLLGGAAAGGTQGVTQGVKRAVAVPYLAGALLGTAAAFKIWGVVPFVVVVGWQLIARGAARGARVAVGGLAAIVVICLPTLALAGPRMTKDVLSAQLQRQGGLPDGSRLDMLSSLSLILPGSGGRLAGGAFVLVVLVGAFAAAVTLATPGAAVYVVLLLANLAVLLESPDYYTHYSDFAAVPIALTLGVALGRAIELTRWRRALLSAPALAALVGLVAIQVGGDARLHETTPYPAATVERLAANAHCVISDTPAALILANLISRDLDRGCPVRVDVTGVTYVSQRVVNAQGVPVSRVHNPLWQKDVRSFFTSAPMLIVARHGNDGISAKTQKYLSAHLRKVFHEPGTTVYVHRGALARHHRHRLA